MEDAKCKNDICNILDKNIVLYGGKNMNKDNNFEISTYKIKSFKDIKDVHYNGNLDEYFRAVSECDITNDTVMILNDMYELIKKLR